MKQIFINLPVQDLEKAVEFYSEIGLSKNPTFSDENQKCMVWSEQIYVMLHSHKQFSLYSEKNISSTNSINAYFTLPVDSLKTLNELVEKALTFGIQETSPILDEGFMQLRKIEDFDGHIWDIIHMDLNKFKQ